MCDGGGGAEVDEGGGREWGVGVEEIVSMK